MRVPSFISHADRRHLAAPNLGMSNVATEIRHPRETPTRRHTQDEIENR